MPKKVAKEVKIAKENNIVQSEDKNKKKMDKGKEKEGRFKEEKIQSS